MSLTVIPAYGRNYRSRAEVLEAWNQNKDFQIASVGPDMGRYINMKQAIEAGLEVWVRYKHNAMIIKVTR